MTRQKELFELLDTLFLLHKDLIHLVVQYSILTEWEPTAMSFWEPVESPCGIVGSSPYLYVCFKSDQGSISKYNINGEIIAKHPLVNPFAVDIDTDKLYVATEENVTILNFQLEIISRWPLPRKAEFLSRGIKVDNKVFYLTLANFHEIFICNTENGELITTWGKSEPNKIEFECPRGVTVDNTMVYICDSGNHRIQVLTKGQGNYVTHWGGNEEFTNPLSIFNDIYNQIFYIGDYYCLHLYTKDGICRQVIGKSFDYVRGTSYLNDCLFVSDYGNRKIHIFKQKLE